MYWSSKNTRMSNAGIHIKILNNIITNTWPRNTFDRGLAFLCTGETAWFVFWQVY